MSCDNESKPFARFIPRAEKKVWADAEVSPAEQKVLEQYISNQCFDIRQWGERLLEYCADIERPISPLWKRYSGALGINVDPVLFYSHRLYADNKTAILNEVVEPPHDQHRLFGMAIVAQDTPHRTSAAIYDMYCEEQGIPFPEAQAAYPKIADAVYHAMRRIFWVKWFKEVPRPRQHIGTFMENQFSVPHPNHPAWGQGHKTCAYATLRAAEITFNKDASPALRQFVDEIGDMRCDILVHYLEDGECSTDVVDLFIYDSTLGIPDREAA